MAFGASYGPLRSRMRVSEERDEGFGGGGMRASEEQDEDFGGAGRAGRHDTMVHLVPGDADERSPA